jgi:UMF1 family MFS transporter
MMLVDVERGRAEGTALASKLEDLSQIRTGNEDSNLSQQVRDELDESFSYQHS